MRATKHNRARRYRGIKLTAFFVVALAYVLILSDGWAQYFTGLQGTIWIDRRIGGFPLALIVGIFCIWLPDRFIERAQEVLVSASRKSMTSVPVTALRIFGWVIYLVPVLFLALYYAF